MELLRLESVGYTISGDTILDGVTLSVGGTDFLSIIGPNGGGKSTLLQLIVGLKTPTRGTILLMGNTPRVGRSKIGYLPQYPEFDRGFPISVEETVALATLQNRWRGFLSKSDLERAHHWLAQVGVYHLAKRNLRHLSGGERQRILLARALINEPRLLILDEPTAAVDTEGEKQFYDILGELNRHMAIIMVTHDLTAVSAISRSVACLNKRLFYHGDAHLEHADIAEAYQCPVDLIAHGHPHRIFPRHDHSAE
ncbi:ABC transporter ATP-binding protein [bacterium]|nr:ABC transporter ATP-binding protein [bacterium]